MTTTEIRYVIERDGLYAYTAATGHEELGLIQEHKPDLYLTESDAADSLRDEGLSVRRVQIETTYTLLED